MSVENLYKSNSDFIKADDLQGKTIELTIDEVTIEEIEGTPKIVLSFQGKEKKLILNKTNADVLADTYGDDEDTWEGKELVLYPSKVNYNGKMVKCLRVRIDTPAVSPAEQGESTPPF
ncbi:MAG: hypothetical protein ACUZ8H_04755 [Candidatus Anammoxibacter sp.]